jgi:hypothetical protein
MDEQLKRNSAITAKDTPSETPLHQQMSEEQRIIWAAKNRGVFTEIAKRHQINGKPASRAYVSAIFHGKNPVESAASRRISQSLDAAIQASDLKDVAA